jgi:dihydroorotate dehydrogenase
MIRALFIWAGDQDITATVTGVLLDNPHRAYAANHPHPDFVRPLPRERCKRFQSTIILIVSFDLYSILRPLLFRLEPERAHAAALAALQCAHRMRWLPRMPRDPHAAVTRMGLHFANRLGLAAGVDKNARYVDAMGALGFGFVEVGTITLRAQAGQPRPRLFRLAHAEALINRMGFPNDGAAAVAARLARRARGVVCGVNIGKNAATPLDAAVRDYVDCFRAIAPWADYVAINVSSPNTKELRRLQQAELLRPIMEGLIAERVQVQARIGRSLPMLVKVSPDLAEDEMLQLASLVRTLSIDGVIAVNTTVSRPGVAAGDAGMQEGGLSGAPLLPLALQSVSRLRAALGPGPTIVGVGGVRSGADALAMVQAGADLVQVYTSLVYRGPRMMRETLQALADYKA